MKVIAFTGSRGNKPVFKQREDAVYNLIIQILEHEKPDLVIVGDASGVDNCVRIASRLVLDRPVAMFRAEWDRFGKSAGAIRNRDMCEAMNILGGDRVWAFPDSSSKGTYNMIRTSLNHNLNVVAIPTLSHS